MKVKYGGLHRKLRESNETAINNFNEFINMVGVNSELNNAILLIGISYSYSRNLNREIEALQPDFCWTERSDDFSNAKNSPKNQWYQLIFPFSINPIFLTDDSSAPLIAKDFDEESNKIQQVFEYFKNSGILNKFSLIVFDSSTSKFLFPSIEFVTYPSFISYLFYYFLEVGGELFVTLNNITNQTQLDFPNNLKELELLKTIIENRTRINNMKQNDEIFGQKFIYVNYHDLLRKKNSFKVDRIKIGRLNGSTEEYIIPKINEEIVRENNIEYLRRNLLGSNIEYFQNEHEHKHEPEEVKANRNIYIQPEYPIKKTNYLIGPFIKITKTRNLSIDINNIEDFKRIFSVIYNDLIIHNSHPETPLKNLDGLNSLFI